VQSVINALDAMWEFDTNNNLTVNVRGRELGEKADGDILTFIDSQNVTEIAGLTIILEGKSLRNSELNYNLENSRATMVVAGWYEATVTAPGYRPYSYYFYKDYARQDVLFDLVRTGDNPYTITDVLNILKQLAGLITLTEIQTRVYDFAGVGEVGIGNALEILKALAGLVEPLSIPPEITPIPINLPRPNENGITPGLGENTLILEFDVTVYREGAALEFTEFPRAIPSETSRNEFDIDNEISTNKQAGVISYYVFESLWATGEFTVGFDISPAQLRTIRGFTDDNFNIEVSFTSYRMGVISTDTIMISRTQLINNRVGRFVEIAIISFEDGNYVLNTAF